MSSGWELCHSASSHQLSARWVTPGRSWDNACVEKVDLSENRPKRSDQKCIGDRRKSFIGHPDATHFRRGFCERVFQQLQALFLIDPTGPVVEDMAIVSIHEIITAHTVIRLDHLISQKVESSLRG
jgi:hypothetical protein